jgi:hypothetical protein
MNDTSHRASDPRNPPDPAASAGPSAALRAAAEGRAVVQRRAGWVAVAGAAAAVAVALWLFGRETRPWLVVFVVLGVGQVAADLHWRRFGAVFTPTRRLSPASLLAACAGGMWFLLAFEASQRLLQGRLADALAGSVWEGLVPGLVWTLLPAGAVALVVAAVVARRVFAEAVVEGRVAARAPHDIAWVGATLGVVAFVSWGWRAASDGLTQGLALFLAEGSTPLLVQFGAYAALRPLLSRREARAAGPPLALIDLRGPAAWPLGPARTLHALATAWADQVGPVLVVRPAPAAAAAAGNPARWAYAAGQGAELFVGDAAAARRRIADWHAAGAAREVFVGAPDALVPLGAELPGNPLRLLLVDAGSDARDLAEARHALPKRRTLVWNDGGPVLPRLPMLTGALEARGALFERLRADAATAPPQRSVGVIGRARSDAVADRLVALLDQSEGADGVAIDATRPPCGAGARFDELVLLVDAAWLAGDEAARVEVAALAPLAAAAGQVVVVLLQPSTAPPERIVAAARLAGAAASLRLCGAVGDDAGLETLAGRLRRREGSVAAATATATATEVPAPDTAPDPTSATAPDRTQAAVPDPSAAEPPWRVELVARITEATAYAVATIGDALGTLGPRLAFRSPADLGPGADTTAQRHEALHRADLVVLLVGRGPDEQPFFDAEVETVLALRKPLLPVLLDGAELPGHWRREPIYAELQAIQLLRLDLLGGAPGGLRELARAAESLLRGAARRPAPRQLLVYGVAPSAWVAPNTLAAMLQDVEAGPGDVALVPGAPGADTFVDLCRLAGVPTWRIPGDWMRALDAAVVECETWDGEFTRLLVGPVPPEAPEIRARLDAVTQRLRARGATVHGAGPAEPAEPAEPQT